MHHQHLLVIRFSALGDVAMTVPIVWALARQYPHLRITVLSRFSARASVGLMCGSRIRSS